LTFLYLSLIIIWINESETIIQAAVIKIPDKVPEAVLATAENYFERGSGWFTKVKLNESGFSSLGPKSMSWLNKKSYKIAELANAPQAPGPDWDVALHTTTVSYSNIGNCSFYLRVLTYNDPMVILAP